LYYKAKEQWSGNVEWDVFNMKFKNVFNFKGKLNKHDIKNGLEVDKGKFDGIKKGTEVIWNEYDIYGKTSDGKCYIKRITGWEYFEQE